MTYKEAMIQEMTGRGMFLSQATSVIEEFIQSKKSEDMADKWHEDPSEHPVEVVTLLWMRVKKHADEWLSENAPEAWFLPMFRYSDSELSQMMAQRKSRMANK